MLIGFLAQDVHVDGMRENNFSAAAGLTQYVQIANGRMAVYAKRDGTLLLGPVRHAAIAGCGSPSASQILFDPIARRWIIAWLAGDGAAQCIAVSAGADATGSYTHYRFPIEGGHASDAVMAMWHDAYYFTYARSGPDGAWLGPRACAVNRAAMLARAAASMRCHDVGKQYGPLSVAGLDGTTRAPSKQSPTFLVSLDLTDGGRGSRLFLWRFGFASKRLAAPIAIPVAPYTMACASSGGRACIDQPPPGDLLQAMGQRLAPRLAYHNDAAGESLAIAHAVDAGGRIGIRWYEVRDPGGAAMLYQQGTHAPDLNHRWMPAMAIDRAGNIGLGYRVAGAGTPPSIRYTARQRTDPHGRMQGERFVMEGSGVTLDDDEEQHRWQGALSLDPSDGCTFWTTQQYVPLTGRATWHTRIASFKLANCQP